MILSTTTNLPICDPNTFRRLFGSSSHISQQTTALGKIVPARVKPERNSSRSFGAVAKKVETTLTSKGGGKKTVHATSQRDVFPVLERVKKLKRRTSQHLLSVGRDVMGIEQFRPGQEEAFDHILKQRNVLAVMPTGSGKSLLYQLPSLILPGLTVVVSPLIALIKDQIDKMRSLGVAVVRIDSTLTTKQRRDMDALAQSPGGRLLLTTPERMADPEFREFLSTSAAGVGVSLFVVDEAHCVSQWGHDFRPAYLSMRKAIEDLGNPQILATTATAPPHVRDDILHQLGIPDAHLVTTTFDRPNLHYEVIAVPGDDDKNKALVTLLKKLPTPGIVYCATVKMVESLSESLSRHGIAVSKYHGRLTKKERDANQNAFMASRELTMVATNAFGLGVDKSDIRNVMHYHVPGSLEAYAQEAGRGGRDRKPARCVLLFSPDDVAIQEYFLKGTYPTRRQVRAVFNTLKAWENHEDTPSNIQNLAIGSQVGTQRTRTILSLLKDEGFVVEREEDVFVLSDPPPDDAELNAKAKQYEARRIADRRRLDSLLEYVGTADCRNRTILAYLGESKTEACGRCDNCLRSRDAALLAAREAIRLEDGVLSVLSAEDDEISIRTRPLAKAKLIRIDEPMKVAADESAPIDRNSGARPPQNDSARQEIETLTAQQSADVAQDFYLDDELEADDDDYEDDDEFQDDDDDVEAIEKTAADLVAEGYSPEEAEITILARKRVPKPPKQKKRTTHDIDEPRKKRRRRRKRRGLALPGKESFTSPVLVQESKPLEERSRRRRHKSADAGPLVEYVRGPLRINMTPVASATPNDVARHAGKAKKHRRRKSRGPASNGAPSFTNGAWVNHSTSSGVPQSAIDANGVPFKKKRRRRRKRRANDLPNADAPIDFFSSTAAPPPPGSGKKRRRRRRKRGGGAVPATANATPTKSE